jgi:hypothetical protein
VTGGDTSHYTMSDLVASCYIIENQNVY